MGLLQKLFGPPSKDVFARELMTALRRAGDREDMVYERAEFRIVRPKSKRVSNLGNVYAEHCQLPRSQRKAHIAALAQTFLAAQNDLPDDFDAARPHLRPKVWTRAQFVNMELQQRLGGEQNLEIPLYPLGDHLMTTVVYDQTASMRSLSDEDLDRWNTNYYQAMETARLNLEESTLAWFRIGDQFHSAMTGDNYDSSRVLLTETICDFDVLGEPIAMVASRDSMMVCGADDLDGLTMMLDLTEQTLQQEPRPLSGIPLRLVDGEWEDWQPPSDHPLHERFGWLAQKFLAPLYAEQKELLDKLHEKEGTDLFVASFSAMSKEQTGQQFSYCVWGEGVDGLLPESQLILFATEPSDEQSEQPLPGGHWSRVREVVGDLMQPVPDHYPPRWRVREFPSQQHLEMIGTLDW